MFFSPKEQQWLQRRYLACEPEIIEKANISIKFFANIYLPRDSSKEQHWLQRRYLACEQKIIEKALSKRFRAWIFSFANNTKLSTAKHEEETAVSNLLHELEKDNCGSCFPNRLSKQKFNRACHCLSSRLTEELSSSRTGIVVISLLKCIIDDQISGILSLNFTAWKCLLMFHVLFLFGDFDRGLLRFL